MTDAVIQVKNLSKAYKRYHTKWSRLGEWIFPNKQLRHQKRWVLQDINFTVFRGQSVGIVGINGAGKSTLLKLIAKTIQPTTGQIDVNGRVAALLELGLGFSRHFTGRENVYMVGQLLGLSVSELNELMPQIESFAEIGDYIDQPVRVYSSGMMVRLAFSVATAQRPEILIIDEALSVGDAYFKQKSFGRIKEFREKGTTLLFVSHDKQAIQALCDRAILLNASQIALEGDPESVMDYYNALLAKQENNTIEQKKLLDGRVQTISGTREAVVTNVSLLDNVGHAVEIIDVGQPITLEVKVRLNTDLPQLVCGYSIRDRLGQWIYGTNTYHKNHVLKDLHQGEERLFRFKFFMNLGPGDYSIQVALVKNDTHFEANYYWQDCAYMFSVVNSTKEHFVGCLWLDSQLEII